jgi:signal transduction histidine kinase
LAAANEHLKRVLESSDRQRQLIADEIHDGVAQQLAAAIMQLQAYAHFQEARSDEAPQALAAAADMLRRAHRETRRLISGVRPPINP